MIEAEKSWIFTNEDWELVNKFRMTKYHQRRMDIKDLGRPINEWDLLKRAIAWDALGRPQE